MTTGRSAILHLGTYKTGSSSLQNLLYANRETLASHGVLYPQSGLVKDEVIGHRHRQLIGRFMKGGVSSYIAPPLRKELRRSPQETCILSSEAWSNPRHLPMLGGFAAELEDTGYERVIGIAFLRRLVDYKVSYYREFTLRQGNKVPYEKYVLSVPGLFDYLFLARSYRSIFGDDLRIIDFAQVEDTVSRFFEASDLFPLLPKLEPVRKANVKPVGALGVEVMRHVNRSGLTREEGMTFLSWFSEQHPDLFEEEWTERERSETLTYGPQYRNKLVQALGWSSEAVDVLLEDRPLRGRPIAEAQATMAAAFDQWSGQRARA